MLVADGDGSWTRRDRLVAVALTIFEASRCGGCGRGLDETWDVDADVQVQEHTCAGCKALDERRREKDPEPGVKLAVTGVEHFDDADEVPPSFD